MKEKNFKSALSVALWIFAVSVVLYGFIIYPKETAKGIRDGLNLLGENIIPSLFPFMVISAYITDSPITYSIFAPFEKLSQFLFKASSQGLCAFILGAFGGYPVGAKVISELYTNKRITKNEGERLILWCVNPSPAFTITAVGSFMLHNTKSGVILYVSLILSSLTIGIIQRFFSDNIIEENAPPLKLNKSYTFVNSVTKGGEGMLSVCLWVLTFSSLSALIPKYINEPTVVLFFKSIFEVTLGCKACASKGLSLPVICALMGFGGLAVIFQIAPYLEKTNQSLKNFIVWRIVNSSLSAFYCSQIIKLFPMEASVYKTVEINNQYFSLTNNITVTLILIFMCLVFILEVDNKRKVC